jgi:hypothetical protein
MKRLFAAVMMSAILAAVGTATMSSNKTLSKKEVKALLANASTPADHNRLAEYYQLRADKFEAEAKDHDEMAKVYPSRGGAAGTKWPASTFTTRHCEDLAKDLRKSAEKARILSSEHAEMARK